MNTQPTQTTAHNNHTYTTERSPIRTNRYHLHAAQATHFLLVVFISLLMIHPMGRQVSLTPTVAEAEDASMDGMVGRQSSGSQLADSLVDPIVIASHWNQPISLNDQLNPCQPYLMVNDINDSYLWYYACALGPNMILRYHMMTRSSVGLVGGYSGSRNLVQLLQNQLGQLFWRMNGGDIAYLSQPTTATNETEPIIILSSLASRIRVDGVLMTLFATSIEIPGNRTDQVLISVEPINTTLANLPSVINYDLATTDATTILLVSLCQARTVRYDSINDSALVFCSNNQQMVWTIPLDFQQPPYVFVTFPEEAFVSDVIRGGNSLFFHVISIMPPLTAGIYAYTNSSTPPTLVLSSATGSCNSFSAWFWNHGTNTLGVACITDRIGLNNALIYLIQNDSSGLPSIHLTPVTPVCQNSDNEAVYSIVPDPFLQGFYISCSDEVYHITGKEVTTVSEIANFCQAIASLQVDRETGLLLGVCDATLLVIDGGLSWIAPIANINCDAMVQLVHASDEASLGVNYLVCTNSSQTDVPEFAVFQLERITREMMQANQAPQATFLFQLVNYPFLAVCGSILFIVENPSPNQPILQYYNATSNSLVSFLPTGIFPILDEILGLNQYLYFQSSHGIVQLPLNDLTSDPVIIANLTDICHDYPTALEGNAITNQLWSVCLSAAMNETALIMIDLNTQMRTVVSVPAVTPFYDIVVDPTMTSTLFLYGNENNFIVYQPGVNLLYLNPIADSDCDEPFNLEVDSNAGVTYASCVGGRIVALSNNFACQAGFQFSRSQCAICSAGYARGQIDGSTALSDYPTCKPCAPGTIAVQPGSSICQPCPIGRFQDLTLSQQVCSYCQPGTYQNLTGATICQSCPLGRFTSDVGLSVCQDCLPGRYANTNASTACTLCDRGSASNLTGLTTPCPDCPAGSEQLQFGGTTCAVCPLGHYSSKGDPCYTCLLNSYQTSMGLECLPCDGQNQDGLICLDGLASVKRGWWAYQVYDPQINQTIFQTTECPPNYCSGSPLQLSNTSTSNGIDGSIIYCSYPRLSSSENWLCAECVNGYVVWGSECVECSKVNGLFITVLIIFLFLLVGFFLKSGMGAAGRMTILLYFAQTAALELNQHTTSTNVHWLQVVNLSLLSINTCFAPLSPLQQILFTYVSPFILFLVLVLIGLIHRLLDHYHLWSRLYQRFEINSYISCTLTILLFSYTNVTVSVVKSLNCVTIAPSITVLFTQPTISCHSQEYQQILLPITLVWLIIYVIGFPIGMSIFLYYHRKHLLAASSTTHRPSDLSDRPLSPLDDLSRSLNEPLSPSPSSANGDDMTEEIVESSNEVGSVVDITITSHVDDDTTTTSQTFPSNIIRTVDGRRLTEFDHRWGLLYLEFSSSAWYGQAGILLRRFAFALTSVLTVRSPVVTFVLFTTLNVIVLLIHLATLPFRSHLLNHVDTGANILLIAISLILTVYATSRPLWVEVILLLIILPPSIIFAGYTLRHHINEFRAKRRRHQPTKRKTPLTNRRMDQTTRNEAKEMDE